MMGNYFIIDGSALISQIRQLRRARPIFDNRKLCIRRFMGFFMSNLRDLHAAQYKRATFYFPSGDDQNVIDHFIIPDFKNPGEVRDISLKYCGHKLKKSAEFDKFVEETVPPRFKGRFSKSEKGIDIEICCDALKLASAGRIDRLFMLTNDSDFVPFFRTLKEFGANISLIHLSDVAQNNYDLLREADSYDVVNERSLYDMFLPAPSPEEIESERLTLESLLGIETLTDMISEKPEAAPSDMKALEDDQFDDS